MEGVSSDEPCSDMASGRADGVHRLIAPRLSVTERYLGGRPDLWNGNEQVSVCVCVCMCAIQAYGTNQLGIAKPYRSHRQRSKRMNAARKVLLKIV